MVCIIREVVIRHETPLLEPYGDCVLKVKYLCCTGEPDREIVFAYSAGDYVVQITDYATVRSVEKRITNQNHKDKPTVIVQVILMQSYVLYQSSEGYLKLFHMDMKKNSKHMSFFKAKTSGRITAAACISKSLVKDSKNMDLMIGYLDGRIDVLPVKWDGECNVSSPYTVDLQGSYIVSMMYSLKHIGNSQCLLLSRKGIAYLAVVHIEPGDDEYRTAFHFDLRAVIGNGHSLVETSWGILAAGFRKNTLHVCWISLGSRKAKEYGHLFSVETSSSRLPFTIIEDKCLGCHHSAHENHLTASYHRKTGMVDKRFPAFNLHFIKSYRHTGIITQCYVRSDITDMKHEWNQFFYTGDTDGRLCIWTLDKKAVNGQYYATDYKLNGAIVAMQPMRNYLAVATSQGDLHLFKMIDNAYFQVLLTVPYNMGQKITCMTTDFLIWGGSYFTFLNLHKLVLGGIVCRKDILSAGKQIATVKTFNNPKSAGCYVIEFYFVDGTMQEIMACPGIRHEELVTLYNTYRIPLKSGEIISAAYTASLGTYLGTNRGRLIWVKNSKVQFLTEPILNSAIKQIVIPHSTVNANVAALLLFDNGTIVSRKDKKHLKSLEGCYTYISDFVFELSDDFAKREKYILVGDRILGTEAGELQYFDMSQLYRERPYCQPGVKATKNKTNGPPSCVVESDYYYKASVGWFFLKDDKFCKSVLDNKTQKYTALLEAKNLRMKYYLACGLPDREIAVAYNSYEVAVCVTDYTPRIPRLMIKTFETPGSPFRIKQVIIMATHVLLQHDSGNAQLLMFNTAGDELISIPRLFKTPDRITAAACIEYDRNYEISILYPYDFMITYLDGSADVHNINWNSDGTLKYTTSYPYVADLKGSYFVSAISSGEHIGNMQSLLLSRKGIVYLAVKGQWLGQKDQIYTTIVQQDLSGILGNGHSLMETCVGILATGFKRHTLNVCRLFMGVKKARTYCHLFSVDTRSSRLPYTVIEEKRRSDHPVIGRETTQQLIVSYYNKSGAITEERFSQYCTHFINGTKHTGIITNCFVQDIFKGIKEHFYSGDTNGNFCIWSFDEKAVTGQTYLNAFKMNGSVTAIQDIYPYTAVSTSQGDLHLFKLVNIESIQLQPTIPCNLGQKITHLTSGQNPISSQHFLLAFLEDGSVQHIKLDNSKMHESEVEQIVRRKKVAKLPVPTKMATCWCLKNVYYILALGTDGILRRTQLSSSRNTTIEMKWKISVIKEFDLGMHILLAGDPEGRVYMLMNDQRMGSNFHIDRLHKQEVIDVAYHSPSSRECFLFSMDVSGTVVIRQVLSERRPVIWTCAVPSPRKIIIVEKQRKVMVIGRGVAARNY